jgi:hypothetical protein
MWKAPYYIIHEYPLKSYTSSLRVGEILYFKILLLLLHYLNPPSAYVQLHDNAGIMFYNG